MIASLSDVVSLAVVQGSYPSPSGDIRRIKWKHIQIVFIHSGAHSGHSVVEAVTILRVFIHDSMNIKDHSFCTLTIRAVFS